MTRSDRTTFAFLVHPRTNVREDLGGIFKPLGLIPNRVYNSALKHLPLKPQVIGNVTFADNPDEVAGHIIMVPEGARSMLERGRSKVLPKIEAAVDLAVELGCGVVGLGALTATIAKGGQLLRKRKDIGVTNGNAFTSWMTYRGLERILDQFPIHNPSIAFVGATGSVGSSVVDLVAKSELSTDITLVARNVPRLEKLADKVRRTDPWMNVTTATDIDAVREADIVVLMTSSADALLKSEHLKPGAIILDDTQPRNTDPALSSERPDVLIVDGGLVSIPGVQVNAHIGLPQGHSYACLAETMLLGLAGHDGHFSIGTPGSEEISTIARHADRYSHFGFDLAHLRSFNNLIDPVATAASRTPRPVRHIVGESIGETAFGF